MHAILQDIRFSFRQLRKSPGFALTAIFTLALGVGANVVVFSVLNALILKPLHIPEGNNLYQVSRKHQGWDTQSYPDYIDYRDKNTTFRGLTAYAFASAGVVIPTSGSQSSTVTEHWGYIASGNYFDLLGIQPALGRLFHQSDERGPDSAPYIVISYGFWRDRFNSDPHVLNSVINLDKHPYTVIGVAPADFHGTELFMWPDFWIPMVNEEQVEGGSFLNERDDHQIYVIGRLKAGVTPQQAGENLNNIARQLARTYTEDDSLDAHLVKPGLLGDSLGGPMRGFLIGVMCMALLVLLAACANLASIFAARAADRSRELSIRLAIGASRWNMVRQLLTESIIIALLGGAFGMLIASFLLNALSNWQPMVQMPMHVIVNPDASVYLVAFLLSLFSGTLFGLLPARQVWNIDASHAMKVGTVVITTFRRLSLRDILLGVQIAICTLLVTASFVALRGMVRSLHANFGFNPENVTLLSTDMGLAGYSDDQSEPLQQRMLNQIAQIPGVTAVGAINHIPLGVSTSDADVYRPETTDYRESNAVTDAIYASITPGYLAAAQTHLLAGRDFTWHDDEKAPSVAIVNATFARTVYGNKSAIGQHFKRSEGHVYEIVGVVEDGKYRTLVENTHPAMFFPMAQNTHSNVYFVVRSQRLRTEVVPALQHIMRATDASLPYTIRSWKESLAFALFPARAATAALGVMGLLAAMLAVTGIFGMASYSVSKRMKELGIRVALGAQSLQLIHAALARPLILLLTGSIAGLFLGILASGLLSYVVYEAAPSDPLVLLGVALTMTLLGLIATFVPARRAQNIDPARLLREE